MPATSSAGSTNATVLYGRSAYQPVLVTRDGSAAAQMRSWLADASPIVGKRRLTARCAPCSAAASTSAGTKPCTRTWASSPSSPASASMPTEASTAP